jgi:diadenosine tetraphosphate (Ap4A) HIT family hydrolase
MASFPIGPFPVVAQWNPARLASALAVSRSRQAPPKPCVLCNENRPPEQEAVVYNNDWLILCNPAPILEPHYTVVARRHQPQRITPAFESAIDLAHALPESHVVFYNGPDSGASAPDHLHLQAVPVAKLPIVQALSLIRAEQVPDWFRWCSNGEARIGMTTTEGLTAVVFESQERESLVSAVRSVLEKLGRADAAEPEPRLNFFATFTAGRYRCWLNPRIANRPDFYGQGPENFLISPGCIDVAGMLVVPRREDFERLNQETVRSLYRQILMPHGDLAQII